MKNALSPLATKAPQAQSPHVDPNPNPLPAVVIDADRTELQISHDGRTDTLAVSDWGVTLHEAIDCTDYSVDAERRVSGRRFVTDPAIDPNTGNIAIGVLLTECADVQQTAVFVIDPQPGAYAMYPLQVPSTSPDADPLVEAFDTYGLRSLYDLQYWNGKLLVQQVGMDGSGSLLVFQPSYTPAGEYAGCVPLNEGEGGAGCPVSNL